MLDEGADGGEYPCVREMFAQKLVCMLVHPEKDDSIAFPQYVAKDGFVVLLGEVVIEQRVQVFILVQVERDGCEPWCVYEDVCLPVLVFQGFGSSHHFLEVGGHRGGRVDGEGYKVSVIFHLWVADGKRKSIRTQADG